MLADQLLRWFYLRSRTHEVSNGARDVRCQECGNNGPKKLLRKVNRLGTPAQHRWRHIRGYEWTVAKNFRQMRTAPNELRIIGGDAPVVVWPPEVLDFGSR